MENSLDILAIGIHPDDVELSCSGTLLRHLALGYRCGILDLTHGELGTRGTAEIRLKEAARAAEILGVQVRETIGLADGLFANDAPSRQRVIEIIRKYRPKIVLCNAIHDRHPDHGRASALVSEACFYSGLRRIETEYEGKAQESWRPQAVYHYVQDRHIRPDIVVDVTDYFEKKMEAIMAFSSQFFNPASDEPNTPISSPEFMETVKAKMAIAGREIGVKYAEAFTVERCPGVDDLFLLK